MRALTKSEMTPRVLGRHPMLSGRNADEAVNIVLRSMVCALSRGMRVEVRGFGSFSVKYRPPRDGRNPRTSEAFNVPGMYVPYFRSGKDIRDQLNAEILKDQ